MIDFIKILGYVPLIILNDGHGPETPGKRTPMFPDGKVIRENTWNKAVIDLMEADAKRLGFKTLQVAPEDINVPLDTRTDRANAAWRAYVAELTAKGVKIPDKKKVAVWYGQHFNAHLNTWHGSDAEGVSTHYYPGSAQGKKLAEAIQKYVSQGTQQTNRGVVASDFHEVRESEMYAVLMEAGFMDDPREAELMDDLAFQKETAVEALMGICEFYGLTYQPAQIMRTGTPIVGLPSASVEQAQAWAKSKGATAQFIKNALLYWTLAPLCGGVDPVGAYAQSAKETGFGKFGGVIDATYNNPCGMKVTNGGGNYDPNAHKRFNSWEMGIIAHLDHDALYAGAKGYPKKDTPDPRHFAWIAGKAPLWEDLGGKWAPNVNYGKDIVAMMKQIQTTTAEKQPTAQEIAVDAAIAAGLINDREYWLNVLEGKTPINLDYLKIAFTNAKDLRRG